MHAISLRFFYRLLLKKCIDIFQEDTLGNGGFCRGHCSYHKEKYVRIYDFIYAPRLCSPDIETENRVL